MGAIPYPPSWLDKLTAWVDRLPGPYLPYYLGLGLLLFVLETALKWWDKTNPVGTFQIHYFDFMLWGAYILAIAHYVKHHAVGALNNFRPSLEVSDEEFEQLKYQLVTAPALKSLFFSLIFLLWGMVVVFWNPTFTKTMKIFTSPASTALELPVIMFYYLVSGAAIYNVAHQLVMVDQIYTKHAHIDPMFPQPLYGLAGLTSRTALAVLFIHFFWVLTSPEILAATPGVITTGLVILLAFALFIWPLWGVHRLLLKEKLRLQSEAQQRLKLVLGELHQRMDKQDYAQLDGLMKGMSSLQMELGMFEKLPTWPWQPDTPRLLLTAILLPLMVWLAQRVLGRFGL